MKRTKQYSTTVENWEQYCEKKGIRPKVEFEQESDSVTVYIETDRLAIRSVNQEDAQNYYKYLYSDQNVMATYYDGKVKDLATTQDRVDILAAHWKNGNLFSGFTIEQKEQDSADSFIGNIVLGNNGLSNKLELSYITAQRTWNHGYTTEAVGSVLCNYVQQVIDESQQFSTTKQDTIQTLSSIFATALTEGNVVSNKLLSKFNFEQYQAPSELYGAMRNHYELKIQESNISLIDTELVGDYSVY